MTIDRLRFARPSAGATRRAHRLRHLRPRQPGGGAAALCRPWRRRPTPPALRPCAGRWPRCRKRQPINRETHSIHAARLGDPEGCILLLREDVGRHNALDKLIGAMAAGGLDPAAGFCPITSRCSVEMVQKAVTSAMPCLVAISAPTTLALRLAAEAGLSLIALARGDSLTIYSEGIARRERAVAWSIWPIRSRSISAPPPRRGGGRDPGSRARSSGSRVCAARSWSISAPIEAKASTRSRWRQFGSSPSSRRRREIYPRLRSYSAASASPGEEEAGFRPRPYCRGEQPITRLKAVLKALSDS